MSSAQTLRMGRLRLGLIAFVLALVADFVDLAFDDFDVLHDGAALALYAVAAWGVGQKGTPLALFWLPVVSAALALWIELGDPTWSYGTLERILCFAFASGAWLLFAFGMLRLTKRSGLASTTRWRRTTLVIGVFVLVPGLVVGTLITDPRPELPFLHVPGSIDSAWWKSILGWLCVAGAGVAAFESVNAALATWRSAGRR